VTVSDDKGSRRTASIPSLAAVDYDTTLGDDRIVYTWRGTAHHNRREHGGEILLKSLLGFRRYLHVNCNGLVREGRYPTTSRMSPVNGGQETTSPRARLSWLSSARRAGTSSWISAGD